MQATNCSINCSIISRSVVLDEYKVTFKVDKEEALQFKLALELIRKYELAALSTLKQKAQVNAKDADIYSLTYNIKRDNVSLYVKLGMLG